MSNFRNVPGNGKWDASTNSLTIAVGDRGLLVLEGGGPSGDELVIAMSNGNLIREYRENSMAPFKRMLMFTAAAPGEVRIYARVGSITGVDYSAPATVLILPRRPSNLDPERVIFFGSPGKDDEDMALESYQKAVAAGGTAYRVGSLQKMYEILTKYRDDGRKINALEVNTHGSPGAAQLGDGSFLTKQSLAYFKGKGFHKVFLPGARVFFHGCNIGEGDRGEEFLKEFGAVFLMAGGGTVAGSTSKGFGMGAFGGKHVYHFWGDVVRVYIDTDGSVKKVEKS